MRVLAVNFAAGHPGRGDPAFTAASITSAARRGLVANCTFSGIPAAWRRSVSSHPDGSPGRHRDTLMTRSPLRACVTRYVTMFADRTY